MSLQNIVVGKDFMLMTNPLIQTFLNEGELSSFICVYMIYVSTCLLVLISEVQTVKHTVTFLTEVKYSCQNLSYLRDI